MNDPVSEIPKVIRLLTQSPPSTQRQTIETFFIPTASFLHPFCRTGTSEYSRWLICCIYRWYKIMSPRIDMQVKSVAYDEANLLLYVSVHQVFGIRSVPGYRAPVDLTTKLWLVKEAANAGDYDRSPKYYIQKQEDLYQVNEFVKFFSVLRIIWFGVLIWQFMATAFCVLGVFMYWPVGWVEEYIMTDEDERDRKVRNCRKG